MKELYYKDRNHFLSQKFAILFEKTLSQHSLMQIDNIIKRFNKKYLNNIKKDMVINLLKYNVDGDWVDRLLKSEKFKKDGFSWDSCQLRYGNVGEKIFHDRVEMIRHTREKYTEEQWKKICVSKRSNLGLKGYILKYGETDGTQRWNSYLKKWKIGINKKKKYGWNSGCTLENFQRLYGVLEGYNIWKNKSIKHKKSLSLDGYIEKYGMYNGTKMWKEACNNRAVTSLSAFIKRYGKIDGALRHKILCHRLSYISSEAYYIEKYGEKLGTEKYKEKIIRASEHKFDGYSKISQELFWEIYNRLYDQLKLECHFHSLDYEVYFFVNKEWAKIINVDFKCRNAIIEFDGTYWHQLPFHVKRDPLRDQYLIERKYKILRVKEADYNNNKQRMIDMCVKFVKENYENP